MEENNDTLIFLVVILAGLSIWLYLKLRKERKERDRIGKENSILVADNVMLEAEQLKFQLQPHTLNNILANLKVIAGKLNTGMDSLSDTLDYILYKGNFNLVSVEDELNFIKKYLALNDLFISEIDSIKIDESQVNRTSKKFSSTCIPHLITAYFIENAFKHGDLNHPEFLRIQIKLTDSVFEIKVINKIKQKSTVKNGGLGLANMKKRLELLHVGKYQLENKPNGQDYIALLTIHL